MLAVVTEEQVGAWAEEIAAVTAGLGHLFARPEPREVFGDLMEGLLSVLRRKNGWTMAERAGHASPDRGQKFLAEASWSVDGLLREPEPDQVGLSAAGSGRFQKTPPVAPLTWQDHAPPE